MSVKIQFESHRMDQTSAKKTEEITFFSPDRAELETYIRENYFEGNDSEIGVVTRNRYFQKGPVWYCSVIGESDYDEDGINITTGRQNGPAKHSLRTICHPLPLEKLSNYRTCWNHFLWVQLENYNVDTMDQKKPSLPSGYNTKTENGEFRVNGKRYAWTENEYAPSSPADDGYQWVKIEGCPVKPGVTSFDFFTYQITETGEYDHESQAYWAVKNNLNQLSARPLLGTFGISGGSWKLEDAAIVPYGKKWNARLVWTWRPDSWDTDLYPPSLRSN